jgi:hypothetical protein
MLYIIYSYVYNLVSRLNIKGQSVNRINIDKQNVERTYNYNVERTHLIRNVEQQ